MSPSTYDYANDTLIFRDLVISSPPVGFIHPDGTIYKLRWDEHILIGRVTDDRRVFRTTRHDEREVGSYTPDGSVHSHGLFEGGDLGWVDADGTVVQAGMILGEEEIGRVQGPNPFAAGAALLLIFYPDEREQMNLAAR